MNQRNPKANDRPAQPLSRFSEVLPSEELRRTQNAPRLKLFKIVKKAGQNLDNELCPENPKSIWTKACDLARNLPHWQDHVGALRVAGDGAISLTWVEGVVRDLLHFLDSIVKQLNVYVTNRVWSHPTAKAALDSLKTYLHGVLDQVEREAADDHRQPDAASTAGATAGIASPLPAIP